MTRSPYRLGLYLRGSGGELAVSASDGEVLGTWGVDDQAGLTEACDALLGLAIDVLPTEASTAGIELVVGIGEIDGLLPPATSRRVGMIHTEGFRDSLEIGHGPLGDAWAIRRVPPPPLVPRSLRRTIRERVTHRGDVLEPIDEASLDAAIEELRRAEVDAVAVCLMHSYAEPSHEHRVAETIARSWPEAEVYLSSEVLPITGEYERATTTALAAFVTPAFLGLVDRLDRFGERLDGTVRCAFLQPNGGLTAERGREAAPRVMLTGLATSVVAAQSIGARMPTPGLLFVSIGDTATSMLALGGGLPEMTGTLVHAGYPSFLPALDVACASIGSKSVAQASVEGGVELAAPSVATLRPLSIGLTVEEAITFLSQTDDASSLPARHHLAAERGSALAGSLGSTEDETAALILETAAVGIAAAVRMVSVEKGVPVGQAAVVIAGRLAETVGPRLATSLRCPVQAAPDLSPAAGLLGAPYRVDVGERLAGTLMELDLTRARERFRVLAARAKEALPDIDVELVCHLHMRYSGESQSLPLAIEPSMAATDALEGMFHELHRSRFTHAEPDEVIEVTALSVSLSSDLPTLAAEHRLRTLEPVATYHDVARSPRADAWSLLERDVFESQVESITKLMDWLMARMARSSIFREAHDYSCFVTSSQGDVLGQSSGLPIHTGSGAFAVRRLLEYWPGEDEISDEDIFILNDPYFSGGAHLPDWTVIAPVIVGGRLVAFACNRSHQLDVGGGALGSQNSDAREIYHEGVRLPPMRLIERGVLRRDLFDLLAINTRYPERIADDVRAMIGSVVRGRDALRSLAEHLSPDRFEAAAAAVLDGAEARARVAIEAIPDGVYHASEAMNNDCWSETPVPIELTLTVKGSDVDADFEGTAPQIPAFKNSPLSNTVSAVCVGIGTLLPQDVPHNSGTFRSIHVIAPVGSVVNAKAPAPVGVGTCYPAWDIAHAVWRALADTVPDLVPAGWGKTSAPVSVGSHGPDRPYVLYHWGAQPGSGGLKGLDGRDVSGDLPALGGFMWPSLEAMEQQFPVRFVRQEFRMDAAGAGEYRGGSGLDYEVEHLAPMVYNLRGEGDRTPSGFGVAGGATGAAAATHLLSPGESEWRPLPQYAIIEVPAGSRFRLLSSGGGGWGPPSRRERGRVVADVQNGLVSPTAARDVYRVSMDQ